MTSICPPLSTSSTSRSTMALFSSDILSPPLGITFCIAFSASPTLPHMERVAKWLAVAATVGMFIGLLMGAAVTNTGSGEGCGKSWPLCHGVFIPEYAFETMVEYSHRLVTGVEGLIILGLSVTAFPLRRRYPELKALIPLMLFTLLLQSGMGAWAVKYPQMPPVMASHFGIDRKSTRLNSSHANISYAVFCL